MITGLVHVATPSDGALEALADTLAALVAGVAAGLVADAVVVVDVPDPEIAAIAEATGAALGLAVAAGPWRAGAALARRDWVLCLTAGDVPASGWIRAVDRFVAGAGRELLIGRMRRPAGTAGPRLLLERRFGAARARPGDVARRDWLLAAAPRRAPVRPLGSRIERR